MTNPKDADIPPLNLREVLRSNYVMRWHSNPDMARFADNLGHHQAAVAQIIALLVETPSAHIMKAALLHDIGENGVGDNPSPFLIAHPHLRDALNEVQQERMLEMGVLIPWLTTAENLWLKFADKLAAYFHVAHVNPAILSQQPWVDARSWLVSTARKLGVSDVITPLLTPTN